jgi:hypothetical protein
VAAVIGLQLVGMVALEAVAAVKTKLVELEHQDKDLMEVLVSNLKMLLAVAVVALPQMDNKHPIADILAV